MSQQELILCEISNVSREQVIYCKLFSEDGK